MGNLWSLNPNDWFSDEDRGVGVNVAADPYKDVREPLVNWLKGEIGQAGPRYEGQNIASMSQPEQQSFDFLRKYGEAGESDVGKAARGEVVNTLSGNYNPANSPYYQAVKAEAQRNLKDTQDEIASRAGGAGRYFSGARLKNQAEASTDVTNNLNILLGQLAENERQNRLNVLPQALQLQQLPLQQAQAFQQLGALPRVLEQGDLDAQLNDWLRSQYEYPMQIGSLASGVQAPPLYQKNTPSFLYEMLTTALVSFSKGAGQAVAAGGAG